MRRQILELTHPANSEFGKKKKKIRKLTVLRLKQ